MRKTGIRQSLMLYVIVVALLCGLVVFLSNYVVSSSLDDSGMQLHCLRSLSDFYKNIADMDLAARAYVYNHESESYEGYVEAMTAAENNLSSIEAVSDAEMSWRIERLRNMIDYYCEPLIQLGTNPGASATYATYNLLNYRARLIARTETGYYGFFTDFMARSREAFQMHWQRQRMIQFVVLFGIIVLAIVMSFVYTQRIYDPIRTLVSNTGRIKQGDYQLEPVKTKLKELTILADAFSNMAESIKGNFNMLKENARLEVALLKQENDNLEMRNLVTETELRSLQAQINPHFVFNTLSMISKSAYASGDTVASELMEKLSEFLRYATEKANKNSTLYEEMESIKNYIFIQKKRFGKRISFDIEMDENVPNIAMPAVVLQPLIENAVMHGVSALTEQAQVSVQVSYGQGRVRIQIEDNGSGMCAEDLEMLMSKLKMGFDSSAGGSGHGIGLSNVYKRLKVFFGTRMQFGMESEEGCGMVIVLGLPVEDVINE